MRSTARLTADALDAASELEAFSRDIGGAGALVTFSGIARTSSANGGEVRGLVLDHHPRMTAQSLEEIASDAGRKFAVEAIHVVHRYGHIEPGETIVFVAAAACHRRAAFEAADYAMDRLKTDAVFWKREDGVDGSHWIEPTEADRHDRSRWDH